MQIDIGGKLFTECRTRGHRTGVYASGNRREIDTCEFILTEHGLEDIQVEQVTDQRWCITAQYAVEERQQWA